MVKIKVVWIRHCLSTANVYKVIEAILGKLSRKSIIDPLCDLNSLEQILYNGKYLFKSVEDYLDSNNSNNSNLSGGKKSYSYKYFSSILPRAVLTMKFLLYGANRRNQKMQRIQYIHEKEGFSNPSKLKAEDSNYDK